MRPKTRQQELTRSLVVVGIAWIVRSPPSTSKLSRLEWYDCLWWLLSACWSYKDNIGNQQYQLIRSDANWWPADKSLWMHLKADDSLLNSMIWLVCILKWRMIKVYECSWYFMTADDSLLHSTICLVCILKWKMCWNVEAEVWSILWS